MPSLLVLSALLVPQADPTAAIDAILKGALAEMPSISLVVEREGKTVYRKALGTIDLAGKIPATTTTPYKVGSVTKGFAAALIQLLARDGKLGIDDPVSKWIDGAPESWKTMTIRNLLTHTSGLQDYTGMPSLALRAMKPIPAPEVVATVGKAKVHFAPNSKFEYSNTNYYLLGLIAERAGASPLEAQLKTRIFDPLGMSATSLERSGLRRNDEAEGSDYKAGKIVASEPIEMGFPFAAGSLVSTADDLAKWLAGYERLVGAPAARLALSPHTLANGEPSFYGFGWVLSTRGQEPQIVHGGSINGFASYVVRLPLSGTNLVVLANTSDPDRIMPLAQAVLDVIEGKPAAPKAIADTNSKLTARLKGVVERMLLGERDDAEFGPEFLKNVPLAEYASLGKGLAEAGPLSRFDLVAEAKGVSLKREYAMTLGPATLTAVFDVDAKGKIVSFRLK